MRKKPQIALVREDGKDILYKDGEILHRLDHIHKYQVYDEGKKIALFYTQSDRKKFMIIDLENDDEIFADLNPQPKTEKSAVLRSGSIYYLARGLKHYFLCLEPIGPLDTKLQRALLDCLSKTG